MNNKQESSESPTGSEWYLPGWAVVTLSVSPDGEMHGLGGERGPGDTDSDRRYVGLDRINELYVRRDSVNKYCQHLNNAANLESVESRYKDLLNHLGVQGHCGAVSEIQALRKSAALDKSNEEKNKEIFTCIPLDSNNRMLRLGFGKNKGKWFIRVDLWYMGFRLVLN
jgi:hypothetical protein